VPDHRPGQRQPLALAARERHALLADPGVEAPGQRGDEPVGAGDPQRLPDLLVARLIVPEAGRAE
jgi:hypothetical protein